MTRSTSERKKLKTQRAHRCDVRAEKIIEDTIEKRNRGYKNIRWNNERNMSGKSKRGTCCTE